MTLSHRLRRLRMERKLSQGDLERATGLRRQYISRVENGRTVPSIETLEKLAGALSIPLYRMFYRGRRAPAARRTPHNGDLHIGGAIRDGSTARLLRLIIRIGQSDRKLLLDTARKLAQLHRRRTARGTSEAAD